MIVWYDSDMIQSDMIWNRFECSICAMVTIWRQARCTIFIFDPLQGSLDSSRGNGPKHWQWSLLCKEVVWKHIAAWSKWKWIVWLVFVHPWPMTVFNIFSFLSTDVPWGQRPAWNAMASACGRLQQWDRVLNQFLDIAGWGGQSTARLELNWVWVLTLFWNFSAFTVLGNHIALCCKAIAVS